MLEKGTPSTSGNHLLLFSFKTYSLWLVDIDINSIFVRLTNIEILLKMTKNLHFCFFFFIYKENTSSERG